MTDFVWQPASQALPDMTLTVGTDAAGAEPLVEPWALTFVDPDGDTQVFLLTEEGRRSLVRVLTGGLHLPG